MIHTAPPSSTCSAQRGTSKHDAVSTHATRRLPDEQQHAQISIYCEPGYTADDLKRLALERFGVRIAAPLRIVPLSKAHLLDPVHWPRATMLGQAYASVLVAWQALSAHVPEVRLAATVHTMNLSLHWLWTGTTSKTIRCSDGRVGQVCLRYRC